MIEKLENNEHVLLMYVADELPPDDRREVEQMLAVDANLREELRRLEEADAGLRQALESLDASSAAPSSEAAAVRRVSREIRRRVVRAVPAYAPRVASARKRSLWWLYPTAAAAMVILAAALWMPRHHTTPPVRNTPSPQISGYYVMTQLYQESWDQPDDEFASIASHDDAVAMTDAPKDTGVPLDPLNQLLLSADANQ